MNESIRIHSNPELKKLYPSTNWDKLPFSEVKRQFNHNLMVASAYLDSLEREKQSIQASKMFSFLRN